MSSKDAAIALSVLMPAFNAGRFLQEAINSVRAQTWPHWTLWIIDDGSTDGSGALMDAAARRPRTNPGITSRELRYGRIIESRAGSGVH